MTCCKSCEALRSARSRATGSVWRTSESKAVALIMIVRSRLVEGAVAAALKVTKSRHFVAPATGGSQRDADRPLCSLPWAADRHVQRVDAPPGSGKPPKHTACH